MPRIHAKHFWIEGQSDAAVYLLPPCIIIVQIKNGKIHLLLKNKMKVEEERCY